VVCHAGTQTCFIEPTVSNNSVFLGIIDDGVAPALPAPALSITL
jgi:hypothetical protein